MNKLIAAKHLFWKTPLFALGAFVALFVILLMILPAVQAQPRNTHLEQRRPIIQPNEQGGSGTSLRIDVNPLLGLNVLAPSHTPAFYDSPVTASGDITVNVGRDCPSAYTTDVATVGLAWVADSGPVDIQFVPTKERGHSIGLLMWDLGAQRWWCTDTLAETNTLHFTNMSQGMYFMWVVTQDKEQVEGDVSVTGPPPTAGS